MIKVASEIHFRRRSTLPGWRTRCTTVRNNNPKAMTTTNPSRVATGVNDRVFQRPIVAAPSARGAQRGRISYMRGESIASHETGSGVICRPSKPNTPNTSHPAGERTKTWSEVRPCRRHQHKATPAARATKSSCPNAVRPPMASGTKKIVAASPASTAHNKNRSIRP